jgi:hypothetical protein
MLIACLDMDEAARSVFAGRRPFISATNLLGPRRFCGGARLARLIKSPEKQGED